MRVVNAGPQPLNIGAVDIGPGETADIDAANETAQAWLKAGVLTKAPAKAADKSGE